MLKKIMVSPNSLSKLSARKQKQRFNIDVESLLSLPGEVAFFWKDQLGHYVGCNEVAANSVKLKSRHEIVDMTDFDLPILPEEAQLLREGDIKVMRAAKPLVFQYTCTMPDRKIEILCFKAPLYDENGKIVGVYGIDNFLATHNLTPFVTQLEEAGIAAGDIKLTLDRQYPSLQPSQKNNLSKRQLQCLYYLVKGMTMKQIGNFIGLSPKTVEHYLDAAKTKLNCHSRMELIGKALLIPFIKDNL